MKLNAFLTSSFICKINKISNSNCSSKETYKDLWCINLKINSPGTPYRKYVHHPEQHLNSMSLTETVQKIESKDKGSSLSCNRIIFLKNGKKKTSPGKNTF